MKAPSVILPSLMLLVSLETIGFVGHTHPDLITSEVGVISVLLMITSIVSLALVNLGVHSNTLVPKARKKHKVHRILDTLLLWLCVPSLLQVYVEAFSGNEFLHRLILFGYLSFSIPALTGLVIVMCSVSWKRENTNPPKTHEKSTM